MDETAHSQRTHNQTFADNAATARLAEALWRLRLAPSALDLHAVLPPEAFVSPVLVDLDVVRTTASVELLDIHATLMLPPGPAEVLAGR